MQNFILQGMFVPAIKGQGTEEQQKKWLPLAYRFQIIGCYAQTELGHGSNVQGLETTATFDPKTDEFVIHSPTLTSSKVILLSTLPLLSIKMLHFFFNLEFLQYLVAWFMILSPCAVVAWWLGKSFHSCSCVCSSDN